MKFWCDTIWLLSDLKWPPRWVTEVTKHPKWCRTKITFRNSKIIFLFFFSLKMGKKLLKMVLNENTTLFLFWIINRFLKISILNRLLLSSWLELVVLQGRATKSSHSYRVSNHRLHFSYALVRKGYACHIKISWTNMITRPETNCLCV